MCEGGADIPVCQPLLIPQRVHGIPPGCPGNLQAHRQEHNEKRERPAKEKRPYPRIHAIREILKPAIRRDVGHGPRNQAGYTNEDHIFTGQQGDDTDCWRPQDFPNPYFLRPPGNGERRQPESAKAGDEYREESPVARDFEPPPFLPVLTVNVVLEKGRVKTLRRAPFPPTSLSRNERCPPCRPVGCEPSAFLYDEIWD